MGENSKIGWTTHTFNPVVGCQKVGPGCDHCYAESWAKRSGLVQWGPGAERRVTSDANWRKPLKWDEAARKAGVIAPVFCASLADVFDNRWPPGVRARLWGLIKQTPNLEWMLLTKRGGNIPGMVPEDWGDGYPNVRLMISVVNQPEADRDVEQLLRIPCAGNGISYEPALGPIDCRPYLSGWWHCSSCGQFTSRGDLPQEDPINGFWCDCRRDTLSAITNGLDWVIVGGESGPGARPFHVAWARQAIAQCRAAGVPCFVKQLGANPVWDEGDPDIRLRDGKGEDWSEWPEDLRVRQFPERRCSGAAAALVEGEAA